MIGGLCQLAFGPNKLNGGKEMGSTTQFTKFGLLVIVALLGVGTGPGQAQSARELAKLHQAKGQVSLNGNAAAKGATILSDGSVTTGARSSAVVSLGKLGRVELLPDSTMKLSYSDSNFSLSMLSAGRVRVSSSSGVSATTTTEHAVITAKNDDKSEFTVDTTCGNTSVAVKKGRVELRAGNSVKQIAAGNQDTAGTARPGCTPAR
jgi:hypothetical protein